MSSMLVRRRRPPKASSDPQKLKAHLHPAPTHPSWYGLWGGGGGLQRSKSGGTKRVRSRSGTQKGVGQEGWQGQTHKQWGMWGGPTGPGFRKVVPQRVGAQNFALFSLSAPIFALFEATLFKAPFESPPPPPLKPPPSPFEAFKALPFEAPPFEAPFPFEANLPFRSQLPFESPSPPLSKPPPPPPFPSNPPSLLPCPSATIF